MGVESLDAGGLKQSGAWRKFGAGNAESYSLDKTRYAIRTLQDEGIIVTGQFVLGFDNDTPETFERTLEFCDEMDIMPMIGILTPTPGSAQYEDFEKAGRLLPGMSWTVFDSQRLLFKHPNFGVEEAEAALSEAMRKGYSMSRILRRVWRAFRRHPDPYLNMIYFFTQLGIRKDIRTVPRT